MTKHNTRAVVAAKIAMMAAMGLGSACTIDDDALDQTEFRTTFGCTKCNLGGSNSANVNMYPINSVHLDGAPNHKGVRFESIENLGGLHFGLTTVGETLAAVDPVTKQIIAEGTGLLGWTLHFNADGEPLEVEILGYNPGIGSWATNGAPISGYALGYKNPINPREKLSVCPDLLEKPDQIAATIIRGEIYDEETRTPIPSPDSITIACFGNAAAKMKLMNYGPKSDFDGLGNAATVAQRQATLRMLTADYCGDGTIFTANGTPLDWRNDLGTVLPAGAPQFADIEAIWDESGALCLSTPRVAELWEVEEHCSLPACTEKMLVNVPHEWITWHKP